MCQLCAQCGEFLRDHRDGRCDPVARKRHSRQQQDRFLLQVPAQNRPTRVPPERGPRGGGG